MAGTRQLFGLAWRESRTARRRLFLYMSSISLGVAALVAIDSFSENVIRSVHEQSRALLGGDVAATRNAAPTNAVDSLRDSLQTHGILSATSTNFLSMALVPRTGGTRLVQVKAVGPGYPFFGQITTNPDAAWGQLQADHNIVVDQSLLVTLNAQIGDTVTLGDAKFVIRGTLLSVPGDVGISAAIGPRVYIPEKYVAETGLVVFGSRAEFETLFKLPPNVGADFFIARFQSRLLNGTNGNVRGAGYNESRLANAIDQLHDYLAVVGLVALLLGGIGVASGVHAFAMKKIDPVAILRCLGASSWQVLAIYTAQAAVMGLLGAAAGVLLGVGMQFLMPLALHDFLPVDVEDRLAPQAILLGLGVGVWVALLFSMRPLIALRRVSPLQALRRDPDSQALRRARTDPLRITLDFAIAVSVLELGLSRANTVQRGIGFTVAIAGAIGILWLSAAALSWTARRVLRPSWPFPLRQGIASLYRPGNQTRAVVLALGFGVFLMGTLYQVQHNILRSLDLRMGQARANVVFFDVQDSQQRGIDSIVRAGHYEMVDETPIVPMRISSINGKSLTDIFAEIDRDRAARNAGQPDPREGRGGGRGGQNRGPRGRGILRREFRSTYRDTLTESEHLVAGRWFTPARADSLGEVSLDTSAAAEMGVKLNDTITWNVQGVLIPTVVTSLREVKWQSFSPNFFAVFNSKSLEKAPKQFAILVRAATPVDIAHLQRDVVTAYPSVSSLDLTLVQKTVTDVLGKVTMAVRFLALISLALGVPVLFSAVAATRRERLREGVLLKTLGATRNQIMRIMLAEYALLGTLGALTGVVLSTLSGWALVHWIFRSEFSPAVGPVAIVALAMISLAVIIGLLTGRDVFAETPMAALREN